MTFAAAERLLLKLYTALLQPDRDQLLRFKRAMRRLDSIKQEGDAKLDRFWSDYEVSLGFRGLGAGWQGAQGSVVQGQSGRQQCTKC